MVERPGIIAPEIAREYDRSPHTVTKVWMQDPDWPRPVGKRGRYNEYDRTAVAAWIATHATRPDPGLEPERLYTTQQLADTLGLDPATIRADVSTGRLPAPDDTADGVNRWHGRTIAAALAGRRAYRRRTAPSQEGNE